MRQLTQLADRLYDWLDRTYGAWLDGPESFGLCVWRLVWSVTLLVTVPTALIVGILILVGVIH